MKGGGRGATKLERERKTRSPDRRSKWPSQSTGNKNLLLLSLTLPFSASLQFVHCPSKIFCPKAHFKSAIISCPFDPLKSWYRLCFGLALARQDELWPGIKNRTLIKYSECHRLLQFRGKPRDETLSLLSQLISSHPMMMIMFCRSVV